MLKRLVLLSIQFLSISSFISPVQATEPLGIQEFLRSQRSTIVPAGARPSLLADFQNPLEEELEGLMASVGDSDKAPPYTQEQEEVLQELFGEAKWNKPDERKLKGTLTQHLLHKLETIQTRRPKTNGDLLRAINETPEKSIVRSGITNFLNGYKDKGWVVYQQGRPITLTTKGEYALEVLRREHAEGRPQPLTHAPKTLSYTNNKPATKKLTGAAKLVDDILQPTPYIHLLEAMEGDDAQTKEQIQNVLWGKGQQLKHYTNTMAIALSKGFVRVIDPEAGTSAITEMGLAALPLLKQKLAKMEEVNRSQAALLAGEDAQEEAPKIDLKKLMQPLLHFLVLDVLSRQEKPMKYQDIIKEIREEYPKYTGKTLEVKDYTVRQSYIAKQEKEFKWIVAKKETGGFSYVISPAGREYLEPLSNKAENMRKSASLGSKRPSASAQNEVEEVVEPGAVVQGPTKKGRVLGNE